MGWTADLLVGIAEHLAANAGATWKPSGAYTASDVRPIIITAVPAAPDVVIVLTPYLVDSDPWLGEVVQGVQVRTRGTKDPRVLLQLVDDVEQAMSGLAGVTLNGVSIVLTELVSGSVFGLDESLRHQYVSNFYIRAARTSPHQMQ